MVASYKQNLVMANLVRNLNHQGKRGDTIHIPKPTRGSASSKAANTQVTLQAPTHPEITISIDRHYEYSKLFEDIVEVQAMDSLRQFTTDKDIVRSSLDNGNVLH